MHLPRWLARRFQRRHSGMEGTFESIYESNAWGDEESPSGPGSTKERGAASMDDLLSVLDDLACRVLLDIVTGSWRPLNLARPPFSLPRPLHEIDERCHHTGGIYADKRLDVWRIADLTPVAGV